LLGVIIAPIARGLGTLAARGIRIGEISRALEKAGIRLDRFVSAREQTSAVMDPFQKLLEIHKTLSEEMRHTATVVWQFAVAIVTLRGGAIVASGTKGFEDSPLGKLVIVIAFFVSLWFSFMLYRQAHDRRAFRDRILAVEEELRKAEPNVFKEAFKEIKRVWAWCSSVLLACILIGESGLGFVLSVAYLFGCLK
jgi:hypothetical protein